jgi:hypothetical protein
MAKTIVCRFIDRISSISAKQGTRELLRTLNIYVNGNFTADGYLLTLNYSITGGIDKVPF